MFYFWGGLPATNSFILAQRFIGKLGRGPCSTNLQLGIMISLRLKIQKNYGTTKQTNVKLLESWKISNFRMAKWGQHSPIPDIDEVETFATLVRSESHFRASSINQAKSTVCRESNQSHHPMYGFCYIRNRTRWQLGLSWTNGWVLVSSNFKRSKNGLFCSGSWGNDQILRWEETNSKVRIQQLTLVAPGRIVHFIYCTWNRPFLVNFKQPCSMDQEYHPKNGGHRGFKSGVQANLTLWFINHRYHQNW